jgi:molybdopterin converting factor small subunit
MDIEVRLFAGLRERHGISLRELSVPENATVREVWALLLPEEPLPANILAARNMEYVDYDVVVIEHHEIAFFPPVTGGMQ